MNAMRRVRCGLFLSLATTLLFSSDFARAAESPENEIHVESYSRAVEFSNDKGAQWVLVKTNQVLHVGDRLRTGPNSRATLRLSASTLVPLDELTEAEILPPETPAMESGLHIWKGVVALFHKGKPKQFKFSSQGSAAGVDGTEFVMSVDEVNGKERTMLAVIDGIVSFGNRRNPPITLTNGERAIVEIGGEPVRIAGFVANNLLQWAFYYPAVLDPRELEFSLAEEQSLSESIAAYRKGNLLGALDRYGNREARSDSERIYYAALLLAVGQVDDASNTLAQIQRADASDRGQRLAAALHRHIAAVKGENPAGAREPELTTELLAASYHEQSLARGDESLKRALHLAKRATTNSPQLGFAWERLAEMEFSFGRTAKAQDVLDKALSLSPLNAQAHALNGFLLAAENKPGRAIESFNRAIAIDSALANAWLGRGLCRIRRGDLAGGQNDLLVAAALEPRRAQLRSYLGKAYQERGDSEHALHELELAKAIDTNDPTGWFYSALVKADENRINEAIRDLEHSQELNDNRRIYRSQFLLDQDEAVRSVNLARLYADSDLNDVAVREAGRAVIADYANYSAHAFLANSYEVERRANLSSRRFEAVSFNEYLLANLLGPANGQLLAQPVNQLEYSSLFERNRLGLIANTEYFGRDAWHHSSAQYGTYNGSSYSLEAEYRTEPGERDNQDYEIRQLEAKFKHNLSAADSLYFHVIDFRSHGGDITQHFNQQDVGPNFRFRERQTPTILAGYHHEWSPENHTLFLAGRLNDRVDTADPYANVLLLDRFGGRNIGLAPVLVQHNYETEVEIYAVEAQQIALVGPHSLIGGVRAQWNEHEISDVTLNAKGPFRLLMGTNNPISIQSEDVSTHTVGLYAYDYWRVTDTLQLAGGLNFTHQSVPVNTISAPPSSAHEHQERLTPKAALIWSPGPFSTFRVSYTRSLTGSDFGQSVRLEPTHVGGLLQTFRDPIPPSLAGNISGADLETVELLWEGRFEDTYLSLGAQRLKAERNRRLGLFLSDTNTNPSYGLSPAWGRIREKIRFMEDALDFSAHQLVGNGFSFGARYRVGFAQLDRSFPEYPTLGVAGLKTRSNLEGWLHTVNLSALYRHDSGVFIRAESILFAQDRERDDRSVQDEDFWQVNVIGGYRFPKQKAEIALGVLNLLDDNYRLDPINAHADLPRNRTFYARLLLNF